MSANQRLALFFLVPQFKRVVGEFDEGVDLRMDRVFSLVVGKRQEAGAGGIVVGIGRQFRDLFRRRGVPLLPLALRHGSIIALSASRCGEVSERRDTRLGQGG